MTTVAEDLLNDFEESGSENGDGEEQNNDSLFANEGYAEDGTPAISAPRPVADGGSMELEGDEGEQQDEDVEGSAPSHLKMEDGEDEEETKARVEKMQLAGVGDVRSVAGLMKQLDPVVEVSLLSPC